MRDRSIITEEKSTIGAGKTGSGASVSVCLATWNGAQFLAEQIGTVLPQLGPGDELVVVDDASSDSTMEILERAARESRLANVRIHQNARNLGAIRTFERALALAKGEIVLLCDQDDRWLPAKVERIRRVFAENTSVTLVHSDAQLMDETGRIYSPSWAAMRPWRPGLLANIARNTFLGCTLAFRRSSLEYCLPFPAGTPMHDQWIGLLHTIFGKVAYLGEPLVQYRRHSGNATAEHHASVAQMARWRLNLIGNLASRWWDASRTRRP